MSQQKAGVLEVSHLQIQYKSKGETVYAVEDVSFSVNRGETFGLVGESGCGKSAACRAIARLLPENGHISGGSVVFEGKDLTLLSEREMADVRGRGVSMIFQEPMTSLNPVLSIRSQIDEVLRRRGVAISERKAAAIDLLRMVDIPEPERRLKQYIHQFSGGMRQRAMIALALASKPALLLADEPTTALDVTIQHQILMLLNRLKHELGMSMILVTHDLGVVRLVCDAVAVMYAGYIVEYAAVDALFSHPSHPYTLGLLNSLPRDEDDRVQLEPIPGAPPDQSVRIKGCPFAPRCPLADTLCENSLPPLIDTGGSHLIRCHHHNGYDSNQNQRQGNKEGQ